MKYEYKVERFSAFNKMKIEKFLNDWGQEGWKVIALSETEITEGGNLTILLIKESDDFGGSGTSK